MDTSDLIRLLTLQDANTRTVLAGTALLGLASGVVGSLAVLRRRALVGDAMAHAALPGVCLAFFVVGDRNFSAFLLGALIIGVVAAWTISAVKRFTRVKEDAAIAMAIGGFFGLGIVLSVVIQHRPAGNRAGLDSFIFGKAATMLRSDALVIAAVAAAVIGVAALLWKEFKLLCFDQDFAVSQGWPAARLDLLLMALVCVCTVAGLPAVGVVLMVALLVIPPVTARCWTDRFGPMLVLAGAIGAGAGALGTALSAVLPAPREALSRGWPTGPMIVLTAAAAFAFSLAAAPRRGLVASLVRQVRLRRRVELDHLLRTVYEWSEPREIPAPWNADDLRVDARGGRRAFKHALRLATRRGFAQRAPGGWNLTPEGAVAAARAVRTHRLWELFMVEHAHIAPDHVDSDADRIEHFLPPELISRLESRLAAEGRLPGSRGEVPLSVHPIPSGRRPPTPRRSP
ncbi:MAG: metal ABC transporter permease [Phycisphaeraceae bacterium]|nr:metal ABC transporter permease [Phycisphaeraceae bacterium]